MEKEIKKILKDEFGFVESDYNQTSKTIIEFLSNIIKEKLEEIKDLKETIHFHIIDKKNKQIMIDDLQDEKEELKKIIKEKEI